MGDEAADWAASLYDDAGRGSRMAATDDQGRHHVGALTVAGGGSGLVERHWFFAPALAPGARSLTLHLPPSYDGHLWQATISLP